MTKKSPAKPMFFKKDEQHLPIRVCSDDRAECFYCRQGLKGEKRHMKSSVKCASCGVHMCLEVARNCFKEFHDLNCAQKLVKKSPDVVQICLIELVVKN